MSEESKAPEGKAAEKSVPKERKYTWNGIRPKNPAIFNDYGNGAKQLRPWAMTDDEIDELIKVRPDLAKLWQQKGAAHKNA